MTSSPIPLDSGVRGALMPALTLGCGALLLIAPALGVSSTPTSLSAALGDETEWRMSSGDVYGTLHVDVEPLTAEPTEAWRVEYASVLGNPVVAGREVFAVVDDRGRKLLVLDLHSGELLAEEKLKRGEHTWLAALDGRVVVTDEKELVVYTWDGVELDKDQSIKGGWSGPPTFYAGYGIAVDDKRKLKLLDLERGRVLADMRGGYGQAGIQRSEEADSLRVTSFGYDGRPGYQGTFLVEYSGVLTGLGGRRPEFEESDERFVARFADEPNRDDMAALRLMRWQHAQNAALRGWYAHLPFGLSGSQGGSFRGVSIRDGQDGGSIYPFVSLPVFDGERFVALNEEGELFRVEPGGGAGVIKRADSMPLDFVAGPASGARDVVHIGNTAFRSGNGEVLYELADLAPSLRIVPAGAGRVLYGTSEGALVCLVDPEVALRIEAEQLANAPSPYDAYAGALPSDDDGLLLIEGRFLPGRVERESEGASVVTRGDDEFELPSAELAAVIEDGELTPMGAAAAVPWPLYSAFRRALLADYVDVVEESFDELVAGGHGREAERLIDDALKLHLDPAWIDELEERLDEAELAPNNARAPRRISENTGNARLTAADNCLAAARWCAALEHGRVASGLVHLGTQLRSNHVELREYGSQLVAAEFPEKLEKTNRTMSWLAWSGELMPAAGAFLAADDSTWTTFASELYDPESAVGVYSPNIRLLSRDDHADVVGSCLSYAEAAVRALDRIVPRELSRIDEQLLQLPLDVRLYANREEYLGDETSSGQPPPQWSAGIYSPSEGISRFYVSRERGSFGVMESSLQATLVHELTHHYLHRRWAGTSGGGSSPGYWIVEGFAVFVEEQVGDPREGAPSFVNRDVPSLHVMAAALREGAMFDPAEFLDITQRDYQGQSQEEIARVSIPGGSLIPLSRIGLAYKQSGAMTWFLMNERGAEGRALLMEYMSDFYRGASDPDAWRALGFESAADFDAEFRAFLARHFDLFS